MVPDETWTMIGQRGHCMGCLRDWVTLGDDSRGVVDEWKN